MSEENVDVVRRSFDAWNRNDWNALAAAYDPGVIGETPEEWPEFEALDGWDAVRRQFERLKEPWDEERVELGEIAAVGDQVLAHIRWFATGTGSGMEVETPLWGLFTLRAGRIVRLQYFLDGSKALQAAGLP